MRCLSPQGVNIEKRRENKMKKFVALLMAAIMVLTCASAFAEGWEIVVVPKDASNPWFVRMNTGVEEYAAATNTEAVTVRQWIRRGKLRNALKIGSEWRIPEITDPPRRGYTPVSYYNKGGLIAFPKEFGVSLSIQPHVIDNLSVT